VPAKTVTFVHDPVFCVERAIVRARSARKTLSTIPSLKDSGIKADISITLHYLREIRRGLQK
jgi:hypothetical protein